MSFLPLKTPRWFAAALLLCLLPVLRSASGIDRFDLQLGSFGGPGWRAEGVRLRLHWVDRKKSRFSLSVARLQVQGLALPLLNARVECDEGVVSDELVSCRQGFLDLPTPVTDNDRSPIRFQWQRAGGEFQFELSAAKIASGVLTLELTGTPDDWTLQIAGKRLSLARLDRLAGELGVATQGMKPRGRLDASVDVKGGGELREVRWTSRFRDVGFSGEPAGIIGEKLGGGWRGVLQLGAQAHRGSSSLSLDAGALLTPWCYLEPGTQTVVAETDFTVDRALRHLQLRRLAYRHPGLVALHGSGRLRLGESAELTGLNIETEELPLASLYGHYLRPVQSSAFLERFYPAGKARVTLAMGAETRLQVDLKEVSISQGGLTAGDAEENFSISGLQGRIHWSSSEAHAEPSRLAWRHGELMRRLDLGAGEAEFELAGRAVSLTRPFALPVLDGSLEAERFSAKFAESGGKVDFQGYLTPISMRRISAEFGWPPLAGQLSAMIPGVSLEQGRLEMRGVALLRLFDGNLLVKNLLLDDLFGPLPVLEADLEVRGIDLQTLTSTFSFGKITGRLDGDVSRLRMEAWEPVSFDASFATPPNDPGPHRISQKAVDNISNLGGAGISGALSRSFLRFFEEFGYDRLGISCRLRGGVCEMGGIDKAETGYYLVKGGGLPRIDIVGFNRRTDWHLLLQKLQQIAAGGDPVIQ